LSAVEVEFDISNCLWDSQHCSVDNI